jgi:glyoxylase-like metal-dependent hydrolase (beta-lactamase superfamily II)
VHDLFGDGSITTVATPGHSPGHLSVIVRLRDAGVIVLAGDAVYTERHYNREALPGFFHSADDVVESVERLRNIVEANDALLVPGHDPESWPKLLADGGIYT